MTTLTETGTEATVPWPELPEVDEVLARVDALGPGWRERARALDEAVEFPHENFAEARAVGLHALCLPSEYGGAGYWLPGRFSPWYRVLERMARWETNTAQLLQVLHQVMEKGTETNQMGAVTAAVAQAMKLARLDG